LWATANDIMKITVLPALKEDAIFVELENENETKIK